MPFIRFDTGDIARIPQAPTACQVSFGVVESFQGRACESIRLSSGRVTNPTSIFQTLREVEGVGRFEVVQTVRDSIRVTVEPLPHSEDPSPEVLRRCRLVFGDDVPVAIGSVPELEPAGSKKHRFIRALE